MKKILDYSLDLTKGCYIGDISYTGYNRMPWAENEFKDGLYGDAIIANTSLGDLCGSATVQVTTAKDANGFRKVYYNYPGRLPVDVGNLSVVSAAALSKEGRKEAKGCMLYYPQATRVRYRVYQLADDSRKHVWLVTLRKGVVDVQGNELAHLLVTVKS